MTHGIYKDVTKCKIAEKFKFTHCYENWRIMCSSLCIKVTDLNILFLLFFCVTQRSRNQIQYVHVTNALILNTFFFMRRDWTSRYVHVYSVSFAVHVVRRSVLVKFVEFANV